MSENYKNNLYISLPTKFLMLYAHLLRITDLLIYTFDIVYKMKIPGICMILCPKYADFIQSNLAPYNTYV